MQSYISEMIDAISLSEAKRYGAALDSADRAEHVAATTATIARLLAFVVTVDAYRS